MSMQMYCYNGFGISAEPFRFADFDTLKKILKETLPEGNFENITKLSQFDNIEELSELNIMENIMGETQGFKAVIGNLIATKEHINLTVAEDVDYGDGAIMYEPKYPWVEQSREEQKLTEDKLIEIFHRWQDILKVPESKQREAYYISVGGYC